MSVMRTELHDNVYRVHLTVFVSPDPAEWTAWLDQLGYTGDRNDPDQVEAQYYRLDPSNNTQGNDNNLIFMKKQDIATLSHELVHFVFNVFDSRHIEIRIENDEPFAYYFEYWINTILDEWSEVRRSKRKKQGVSREKS